MNNMFLATDSQITTELTLIVCEKSVKIRASVAVACQLFEILLRGNSDGYYSRLPNVIDI